MTAQAAAMLLVIALGIYFERRSLSRNAGQPLRPQAPVCRSVSTPSRPAPFTVIAGGRQ